MSFGKALRTDRERRLVEGGPGEEPGLPLPASEAGERELRDDRSPARGISVAPLSPFPFPTEKEEEEEEEGGGLPGSLAQWQRGVSGELATGARVRRSKDPGASSSSSLHPEKSLSDQLTATARCLRQQQQQQRARKEPASPLRSDEINAAQQAYTQKSAAAGPLPLPRPGFQAQPTLLIAPPPKKGTITGGRN